MVWMLGKKSEGSSAVPVEMKATAVQTFAARPVPEPEMSSSGLTPAEQPPSAPAVMNVTLVSPTQFEEALQALVRKTSASKTAVAEPPPPDEAPQVIRETVIIPTRYVEGRVRSGVTIRADGDLIVCGEVSSGAELIAGGHVQVLGTCKGRVYAGVAEGEREANPEARVFMLHCQAELVAIGGQFMCLESVPPGLADRAVIFALQGQTLTAQPLA